MTIISAHLGDPMYIRQALESGRAALRGYMFSRRAWKSPEFLRRLQARALQRSVSIAYYQTDFYRERYKKHGVHPRDIRTLEDIHKLPVITKQDLIENFHAALPKPLNKNHAFLMGTSGSTGQPVEVYKDYTWLAHFIGCGFRIIRLHKVGMSKQGIAFILDLNPSPSIEKIIQKYLKLFPGIALIIPVGQDIVQTMRQLEKANVRYIVTYSGVMRELATLRKDGMGKNLNIIKVGLTGEILDEYTREYIEAAFGCSCYSYYISTEAGAIAIECENKKMHINSDSLMVEILDENGDPLPAGEEGNIVLTCYDGGYGSPIIRYSGCSDVGQILSEGCGCGLNTPVMGPVKGRIVDSIHLPDGRIYHAFSMTIPMEKIQRKYGKERICQYQIVQHELDLVTISLVRNREKAGASDSLSNLMEIIERTYQIQLGPDMNITVQEVETLPKGSNTGMPTPLVLSHIVRKDAEKK